MTDLRMKEFELAAQEMAMHIALCVSSEYIHSWGLLDFIQKLSEYTSEPDIDVLIETLQKEQGL